MPALIQETNEFIDIFSFVFQFMELRDIYPLQKVSKFFYEMIEDLKQTFIRPIYEIGIVSVDKEQLESFVKNKLRSSAGLIPTTVPSSQKKITQNIYDNYYEDRSENKNDGDVLTNVSFNNAEIHVYERINRDFIFKQDRFKVVFFPLFCGPGTSLAVDDFKRLEGFIFLKPKRYSDYSMPSGASFTAVILDDAYHLDYESDPKNVDSPPRMPVKKFGQVSMQKNANPTQVESSLVESIMYILNNSSSCLDLDHSLTVEGKKEEKGSLKLIDKISQMISPKMRNNQVGEYLEKLFRNRYSFYNMLMTNDIRYMTRRLNYFNLPYPVQYQLLKKLYSALVCYHPSLLKNNGKVKVESKPDSIQVSFLQEYSSDAGYNSWEHKTHLVSEIVKIQFYNAERIEFVHEPNSLSNGLKEFVNEKKGCVIV